MPPYPHVAGRRLAQGVDLLVGGRDGNLLSLASTAAVDAVLPEQPEATQPQETQGSAQAPDPPQAPQKTGYVVAVPNGAADSGPAATQAAEPDSEQYRCANTRLPRLPGLSAQPTTVLWPQQGGPTRRPASATHLSLPGASPRCSVRCRSADATAALRLALTGGAQLAALGPADLAELAAALEAAISLGGAVDASATLELATATSAGSEPGGMTTAELRVRLAAAPGSLGSHDDLVAAAQGSDSWLPTLATLLPAAWFPAGEPCQRAGQGGGCARGSRGPTTLGRDPPPPPLHPPTHARP
jgi:hypothetical protein